MDNNYKKMELAQVSEYMRGMFDFRPKIYQQLFTVDCMTKPRVVGVFCRQTGKSETTSKIAIMKARKKTNSKGIHFDTYNVLIFAPTDRQTGLIAEKIRASIRKMPYLSYFHIIRETQREFYFSNGAAIICETTGDSGETVRGYTAHCIILEEAGSIKDSIIQSAILPMGLTTDADVIKIGTPRGKNHFFESSISPLYAIHRYDYKFAIQEGLITQDYIDEMRRTLPDIIFRTEYGAEFIEDQDAYFSYDLVSRCTDINLNWLGEEYKPNCRYYIGCDIARLGQDSTCITIICVNPDNTAQVVHIVELQKVTLDIVITKIEELIAKYHPARVFIDETGLGAGVTDILAKKYNIPRLQQGAQITGFPANREYGDKIVGTKFTIQTKLSMFGNLKALMDIGKLKYPNHPKLIAQLRDFRYEITENQNVKLHHSLYGFDDFVDSLALAAKEINVRSIGFCF